VHARSVAHAHATRAHPAAIGRAQLRDVDISWHAALHRQALELRARTCARPCTPRMRWWWPGSTSFPLGGACRRRPPGQLVAGCRDGAFSLASSRLPRNRMASALLPSRACVQQDGVSCIATTGCACSRMVSVLWPLKWRVFSRMASALRPPGCTLLPHIYLLQAQCLASGVTMCMCWMQPMPAQRSPPPGHEASVAPAPRQGGKGAS
jgi:hypothetical protein